MILGNSPRGSAYVRSLTGDDWTMTDHLLAAVIDTLQAANWQRTDGKGQVPKPIPRPGAKSSQTHHTTLAELEAFAAARREGRRPQRVVDSLTGRVPKES